jgi:hypothetical protein
MARPKRITYLVCCRWRTMCPQCFHVYGGKYPMWSKLCHLALWTCFHLCWFFGVGGNFDTRKVWRSSMEPPPTLAMSHNFLCGGVTWEGLLKPSTNIVVCSMNHTFPSKLNFFFLSKKLMVLVIFQTFNSLCLEHLFLSRKSLVMVIQALVKGVFYFFRLNIFHLLDF